MRSKKGYKLVRGRTLRSPRVRHSTRVQQYGAVRAYTRGVGCSWHGACCCVLAGGGCCVRGSGSEGRVDHARPRRGGAHDHCHAAQGEGGLLLQSACMPCSATQLLTCWAVCRAPPPVASEHAGGVQALSRAPQQWPQQAPLDVPETGWQRPLHCLLARVHVWT